MKLFLATLLSISSLASAHGVQQQLTYDLAANKIVTRSLIYTSSNTLGQPVPINSITAARGAFIEPLLFSPIGAGTGYYARPDFFVDDNNIPVHPTGPGPAWQYDDLLAGTGWAYENSATLPNLKGSKFGYQLLDGLKKWNGTTFVDPGNEQVQLILSDGTTSFTPTAANSVTTNNSANGAVLLSTITSKSANAHSSISLRLLGDGVSLAGDNYGEDGVYVVKFAITSTAMIGLTPVGASDPFYFLLTKNASYAEGAAAASALGIAPSLVQGQVPEPTAMAACAIGALFARRRRKTTPLPLAGGVGGGLSERDRAPGNNSPIERPSPRPSRKREGSSIWAASCVLVTMNASVFAHDGPRVWIADVAGKLVTEKSSNDFDPSDYIESQLFSIDLPDYFGVRTTQFPGFEVPRDGSGNVPASVTIGFKIAGPLLVANAAGNRLVSTTARYGAAAPQMSVSLPGLTGAQAQQFTRVTAVGVVDGFNLPSPPEIGEHNHFAFTLRGDGISSAAAAPNDTYVLPLVLTSASMHRSEWFFIAFNKSDSAPHAAVAASLATPLVDARPGDANFDGFVNFDDLVPLAQNYNQPTGQWWATGDFNFDGVVNFDDLVPLAQNYNKPSAFSTDWHASRATVPEPATTMIVGAVIGTIALPRRRRCA